MRVNTPQRLLVAHRPPLIRFIVAIYRYAPTPGRRYPEIIYNKPYQAGNAPVPRPTGLASRPDVETLAETEGNLVRTGPDSGGSLHTC
ncbi:MAG: hypothetical protein ACI8XM_000259 [Haloarculaceae archaeon]|jgi:hypothetical protein